MRIVPATSMRRILRNLKWLHFTTVAVTGAWLLLFESRNMQAVQQQRELKFVAPLWMQSIRIPSTPPTPPRADNPIKCALSNRANRCHLTRFRSTSRNRFWLSRHSHCGSFRPANLRPKYFAVRSLLQNSLFRPSALASSMFDRTSQAFRPTRMVALF